MDGLTDDLAATLSVVAERDGAPVTTAEVAESLPCGHRATYDRLERLVDSGDLRTKTVGANGRIWWQSGGDGATADRTDRPLWSAGDSMRAASTKAGLAEAVESELEGSDPYDTARVDFAADGRASGTADGRVSRSGTTDGPESPTEAPVDGVDSADALRDAALVSGSVEVGGKDRESEQTVAAVPLRYGVTTFGVLWLTTARAGAFDSRERSKLSSFGDAVAHAMAAVEKEQALVGDQVTELQFRMVDLERLGVEIGEGEIRIDRSVRLDADQYLLFGTASGEAPRTVEALVDRIDHWESVQTEAEWLAGTRVVLRLSEQPLADHLATRGGRFVRIDVVDEDYRATVQVPAERNVRRVVSTVTDAYPTAELVSRRQRPREQVEAGGDPDAPLAELTDRQQAALETAFFAGYFEWPRGQSMAEVAELLDIDRSTFSRHLRVAQKRVLGTVLDGTDRRSLDGPD